MNTCPYCGLHPYEYVDVGIASVPVAVNCCEYGYLLMGIGVYGKDSWPRRKASNKFVKDMSEEAGHKLSMKESVKFFRRNYGLSL